MVLFLDIDGVLHPAICYDTTQLLSRLPILEEVLRQRPGVDVIISSTWRIERTLSDLRALFAPDIESRIISVTPRWQDFQDEASFGTYVRQCEIEHWMRNSSRAWESWVALDDQAHLFQPFCKNLVRTDPDLGLTDESCALLLKRLVD
jgi:hypothetical protein